MQASTPSPSCVSIAVIGDMHGSWDEHDVEWFNASSYDRVLFVGDLGGGPQRNELRVARSVARLSRPALVLPGNHDAAHVAQLAAEVLQQRSLISLLSYGQEKRSRALEAALGPVAMCGYGLHPQRGGPAEFDIISCRPHSMGGPTLSFAPHLSRRYGVGTLAESAARLIEQVDESNARRLLFLAHNGPTGLGEDAEDIWGCDFKRDGGDWGDEDLRLAIEHARRQGKEILAVLAGHMHLGTRTGSERPWRVERDGILYVNAARVPRIFTGSRGGRVRHHVALTIGKDSVQAEERVVELPGASA